MSRLAGRRILLVEDELLVAMTVEDVVRDEGCAIVGPFPRVEPALKAAREEPLDAAILDVNSRASASIRSRKHWRSAMSPSCSPLATTAACFRQSTPTGPHWRSPSCRLN
jgi:DNA-binding response OmpR family regulator